MCPIQRESGMDISAKPAEPASAPPKNHQILALPTWFCFNIWILIFKFFPQYLEIDLVWKLINYKIEK